MEIVMFWWKKAVIYHIYPRSFQDSDDDGVGDLKGVRDRLDYLVWLGVDAIWLSPFYSSPMKDLGYDVSDYCAVDPLFGSMECFDALLIEAHARELRVILDFVPNHTSSLHPWFLSSRRSRDDPKREWYIWRDPAPGGGPPNNWVSHFGGSGWTFDEETQQYYYHAFLEEQPDLNWRNPEVRAAMRDVLRFWLKRGVDGFRIDVASHLVKDAAFRDNPPNPHYDGRGPDIQRLTQTYSSDQPEVQEIIAGLRQIADEFEGDRLLIGELYLPVDRLVRYYGEGLRGLHLPFNFQLLDARWAADDICRLIDKYEAALPEGAWPNWVLSNHDRPRIAARVGEAQARIAAMLILTLRGTPTLYYGDEIGLGRVPVPSDRIRDTWALRESGPDVGRDPSRTPMQWDEGPFAGFSDREPWLPLSPDHTKRNVSVMREDKSSILLLVRELLDYRRKHAALEQGAWRPLGSAGDVLAYERAFGGERIAILLNFSDTPRRVDGLGLETKRIALSTHADRRSEATREVVDIRPNEGLILESS
ncbi:oligo-1,6-glucosidase [Methylocystis echinoides]|uniref:Oligo-1,6-glucosidase n=2 Tax=Methylocystis echinoides TaxID=29468 RepID=A0A9W6GT35_9HYPH|nr:oligo-1,6-glucosidase [Methylocystis echinoides]